MDFSKAPKIFQILPGVFRNLLLSPFPCPSAPCMDHRRGRTGTPKGCYWDDVCVGSVTHRLDLCKRCNHRSIRGAVLRSESVREGSDRLSEGSFQTLGTERTCISFTQRHGTREPCTASGSDQPPKNLVRPSCRPSVENI